MKKGYSSLIKLTMLVLFMAALVAPIVNELTGCPTPLAFVIAFVGFGLLPMRSKNSKGVVSLGLQQEIWVQDIQEVLFQQSLFVPMSTSHDGYVTYKTVHVPQAGGNPSVSIDRSILPAVIGQRTDTELTYNLNEYSTDPVLIRNLDDIQVSYDKRNSVMGQHINTLSETIGNFVANKWATSTASRIVRTTGAASASALAPGATGTRLAITLVDVANLAKRLDNDNVPRTGRKLLMPADMFWQLFTISEIVRASYNGFQVNALATGIVAQLFGFDIMIRPSVVVYDNTPTLKAVGTATATTDDLGCIAWHVDYVAKALGSILVMSDSGDNGGGKPEYYGSLLSALVMLGASKLRSDEKGIAVLVQANS